MKPLLYILLILSSLLQADLPPEVLNAAQAIKNYQEKQRVPGVFAALYYDGVLYAFPLGVADLKIGTRVTPKTLFELGSITKSFTAILLAAESLNGVVKLDDKAAKYLPGNFKGPFSQVTLLQLATHTSSLPRTVPLKSRSSFPAIAQFLKMWQPESPIGHSYLYSNFGFGLLGLALENAAHKPYMDLLSENLLRPLKMDATFLKVPANLKPFEAQGYEKNGGVAEHWPLTLIFAAGALRSSGEDMSLFLAACLNLPGTPPSIAQAIEITKKERFKIKPQQVQAMSWMKTIYPGFTTFSKNGGVTGFATFMGFIPELQTGIVILANKNVSNTPLGTSLLKQLGEGVLKKRR